MGARSRLVRFPVDRPRRLRRTHAITATDPGRLPPVARSRPGCSIVGRVRGAGAAAHEGFHRHRGNLDRACVDGTGLVTVRVHTAAGSSRECDGSRCAGVPAGSPAPRRTRNPSCSSWPSPLPAQQTGARCRSYDSSAKSQPVTSVVRAADSPGSLRCRTETGLRGMRRLSLGTAPAPERDRASVAEHGHGPMSMAMSMAVQGGRRLPRTSPGRGSARDRAPSREHRSEQLDHESLARPQATPLERQP